mgnify:CR=1 FL=1
MAQLWCAEMSNDDSKQRQYDSLAIVMEKRGVSGCATVCPGATPIEKAKCMFQCLRHNTHFHAGARTVEVRPTFISAFGWCLVSCVTGGCCRCTTKHSHRWTRTNHGIAFFRLRPSAPACFPDSLLVLSPVCFGSYVLFPRFCLFRRLAALGWNLEHAIPLFRLRCAMHNTTSTHFPMRARERDGLRPWWHRRFRRYIPHRVRRKWSHQ